MLLIWHGSPSFKASVITSQQLDFSLSIVPLTLTKTMTVSMRLIYFYIYLLKLIKLPCVVVFFSQRICVHDHSDLLVWFKPFITWHVFLSLKLFEYLRVSSRPLISLYICMTYSVKQALRGYLYILNVKYNRG